jgi:pimeloyl-ACP methyl ester carboxylesterase
MIVIRRVFLLILVMGAAALAAVAPVREAFVLRGHEQILYHFPSATHQSGTHAPVLFIPGDAGWHGAAVDMARMMSSLGYDVYGLEVRRYLESFTDHRGALTETKMAEDMQQTVREVDSLAGRPVILVGWSQGAAMAVLAAARMTRKELVSGVLTIALPEAASLGWRWQDSMRSLIGGDPREPQFQVAPLLPRVAPIPFWMIYGTRDHFTPVEAARRLVALARRPFRRHEIEGGDHRLGGHRAELLASLKSGLAWLERRAVGDVPSPVPALADPIAPEH